LQAVSLNVQQYGHANCVTADGRKSTMLMLLCKEQLGCLDDDESLVVLEFLMLGCNADPRLVDAHLNNCVMLAASGDNVLIFRAFYERAASLRDGGFDWGAKNALGKNLWRILCASWSDCPLLALVRELMENEFLEAGGRHADDLQVAASSSNPEWHQVREDLGLHILHPWNPDRLLAWQCFC
jgi:hypothetical protein